MIFLILTVIEKLKINILEIIKNTKVLDDYGFAFFDEIKSFILEKPKNNNNGDVAINVAFVIAKQLKANPYYIANLLSLEFKNIKNVEKIEIASPGFINFFLKAEFYKEELESILENKTNYLRGFLSHLNKKINLEFVSANPTGPLHIGHARGAVIGDILSRLYKFLGFTVVKEYYINDAGSQIDKIAKSLFFRYGEVCKKQDVLLDVSSTKILEGEEFYPGEYLIKAAEDIYKKSGNFFLLEDKNKTLLEFKNLAVHYMINIIKSNLKMLNVEHDVFSSEKEIATDSKYIKLIDQLMKDDLVYRGIIDPPKGMMLENYEQREQLLVRSTNYGDDIDRPLEKSNGERTYFANDMMYHKDKIERKFTDIVNILGIDHKGYVTRISSVVKSLSNNKVTCSVILCALVNILEDGIAVKMSKRSGNFLTVEDVLLEVPPSVFRFLMITKKNEIFIDFDLKKVVMQNNDNPVFYIQYALVRMKSLFKIYQEVFLEEFKEDISLIDYMDFENFHYKNLLQNIVNFKKDLEITYLNSDTHRIYLFMYEVASNFHSIWNYGKEHNNFKFVVNDNKNLTISRLSLIKALYYVMEISFEILGIEILKDM